MHAARPRLLLSLLAAVLLLICAALVAISGVELATGYTFSRVELGLVVLGIVGSAFTPAVLWFFHIRRRVWANSSRVLVLLGQVRGAVLAGIDQLRAFGPDCARHRRLLGALFGSYRRDTGRRQLDGLESAVAGRRAGHGRDRGLASPAHCVDARGIPTRLRGVVADHSGAGNRDRHRALWHRVARRQRALEPIS